MSPREDSATGADGDESDPDDREPDTTIGPLPTRRPARPATGEGGPPRRPASREARPGFGATDVAMVALSDQPTPRRADLPDREVPDEDTHATALNPLSPEPPDGATSVTALPEGEEPPESDTNVMDLKELRAASPAVPWDTSPSALLPDAVDVRKPAPKPEPSVAGRRPGATARKPTVGELRASPGPEPAPSPPPRRATGEQPLPRPEPSRKLQNEPSLGSGKKPTRGELPVQSAPSLTAARKPTRGEIPVEAVTTAPGVEEQATRPMDRKEAERVLAQREREKAAPKGKRTMLKDEATGLLPIDELRAKGLPGDDPPRERPRERPEDVADEPTGSISTTEGAPLPKPRGRAGGALEKLGKLTGFHSLSKLTSGGRMLTGFTSLSALNAMPGRKLGFQVVLGGAMLLLGLGLAIHVFTRTDHPDEEQLQVLYPYGFTGGMQPNGRIAPAASEVSYRFQETVECGSSLCQKYEVVGRDGVFQIVMTVRKDDSGNWVLVGGPPR